jgi:predicted RND superfamily exporter protein
MLERLIVFLIRTRFIWLALVAALTALAVWSLSHGKLATSIAAVLLGESESYIHYREVRVPQFGSDEQVAIAFDAAGLASAEGLRNLAQAVRKLETLPYVRRVDSVLNAVAIRSSGGALEIGRYGKEAMADPARASRLLDDMRKDPLAVGFAISPDGMSSSLTVELTHAEDRPSEKLPEMMAEMEDILKSHGIGATGVHAAGIPVVISEVIKQTMISINRYLPMACGLLLLIVFLMFGRLWPVVICGTVGGLASLWTMGLSVAWDESIHVLLVLVPAIIVTVACSDVIHLCSAYLLELGTGKSKSEAIVAAGSEVGRACAFTSLTALAGFVALALIPTPVARQLGLVLGLGVGCALLLAMTLGPILFSLMPTPKPWRTGRTLSNLSGRFMDGLLARIEQTSSAHPWAIVAVFAAIVALSGWGIARMRIDTDLSGRMPEDNPLRVAERYFDQHFRGTNCLELFIDSGEPEGILDPDLFAEMAAFQRQLEGLPEVSRVLSLVDVVRTMHGHLGSPGGELPATREALAQYLLLLESSGPDSGLDRIVDFDRQTVRMLVYLSGRLVRDTYELGMKVKGLSGPLTTAGASIETSGTSYLAGEWLDQILFGQLQGLGSSLVVVAFMMMLALRSFRMGLWAMVPNLIPLLAIGGVAGFLWGQVDSDLFAVAIMADGIAVDDTIHFLTRYRVEMQKTSDPSAALRGAFHFSGRAVIITALVLIAGFAPFALSDYLPLHMLGGMMSFTLLLALVTELFLVPAMARLGVLKAKRLEGGRTLL